MFQDTEVSHNLFRTVLILAILIFITTLVFDAYLMILNKRLNEYAKIVSQNMQLAHVVLDYGNGHRRAFEGEVTPSGLSLMDVLFLASEAGNFKVGFKEVDNKMLVDSIDNYTNGGGHYWEISFSGVDWKRRLDEFDARQLIFTGGMTANLTYR
jgi:hypothetical protein